MQAFLHLKQQKTKVQHIERIFSILRMLGDNLGLRKGKYHVLALFWQLLNGKE